MNLQELIETLQRFQAEGGKEVTAVTRINNKIYILPIRVGWDNEFVDEKELALEVEQESP